ncbi:RNA-directed DNA polymerase from mobile element jockey [Trichonephila clavipes]|nr:RNA-directed DNA polymerase from mobile element jockey [Trichonephila clavipes]
MAIVVTPFSRSSVVVERKNSLILIQIPHLLGEALLVLNDGTPTHSSFSYYNIKEALDIAAATSDIYSRCKWSVLRSIGSDNLPVLIEVDVKFRKHRPRENFRNFRKANWDEYRALIDKKIKQTTEGDFVKYGNSSARPELNKINAEIKRTYALIKREKWYELCSMLDARSSDTKIWRLARSFCQERPLSKATSTIVNTSNRAPLEDGIVQT